MASEGHVPSQPIMIIITIIITLKNVFVISCCCCCCPWSLGSVVHFSQNLAGSTHWPADTITNINNINNIIHFLPEDAILLLQTIWSTGPLSPSAPPLRYYFSWGPPSPPQIFFGRKMNYLNIDNVLYAFSSEQVEGNPVQILLTAFWCFWTRFLSHGFSLFSHLHLNHMSIFSMAELGLYTGIAGLYTYWYQLFSR